MGGSISTPCGFILSTARCDALTFVGTLNREPTSAAAATSKNLDVLDVGLSGGVGLAHGLGSRSISTARTSSTVGLGSAFRGPYFFSRNATAGSVTNTMLERHERGGYQRSTIRRQAG